MMHTTKITFILHGKLKSASALKAKISSLFAKGYDLHFKTTDKETGAKNSTIEATKESNDIIIICGGDGSINEMVNGYISSFQTNSVKFGILPLGTGNDFAKSLGVKNNLKELKELIEKDQVIDVSVFKMDYLNKSKQASSRYFVNVADIGIGGFVAENVGNSSKLLGANFTYIKAIVSSFIKYKKQPVALTSDSFNWSGPVLSLCMCNGKYFGSGMCIAPDAQIDDDQLQLTILGNVSLMDYLKNMSNIKKGHKIKHKEVTYTSVHNCKIESKGIPCPIDMDGEFIGYTPIEVNLAKMTMKIYGVNKNHAYT